MDSSLIKAAVNTALVPASLAKDVVTGFGALTDDKQSATERRLAKVGRNLNKAQKDLDSMLDD